MKLHRRGFFGWIAGAFGAAGAVALAGPSPVKALALNALPAVTPAAPVPMMLRVIHEIKPNFEVKLSQLIPRPAAELSTIKPWMTEEMEASVYLDIQTALSIEHPLVEFSEYEGRYPERRRVRTTTYQPAHGPVCGSHPPASDFRLPIHARPVSSNPLPKGNPSYSL